MRLSATERIMREAENEAAAASPVPARLPGMVDARPEDAGGAVDVDLRDFSSGIAVGAEDDEEGKTQVDVKRSAEALQKLRSYGGAPPPPPASASASWPAPAKPGLRPAGGLPPGRPAAAISVAPPPQPALPTPRPQPALLGPPEPSRVSVSFEGEVFRRPKSVGRRMGMLIAAATAVSVAVTAGAWTARSGLAPGAAAAPPMRGGEAPTPAAVAQSRPRRVTATVVPTRPVEAAPALPRFPQETPRPPAPEGAPSPQPVRQAGSEAVPSALGGETGRRSLGAGPVAKKSRHVRKVAWKTRHLKSAAAVEAAGSTRRRQTGVVRPAEARRAVDAGRAASRDPDATLPFSE